MWKSLLVVPCLFTTAAFADIEGMSLTNNRGGSITAKGQTGYFSVNKSRPNGDFFSVSSGKSIALPMMNAAMKGVPGVDFASLDGTNNKAVARGADVTLALSSYSTVDCPAYGYINATFTASGQAPIGTNTSYGITFNGGNTTGCASTINGLSSNPSVLTNNWFGGSVGTTYYWTLAGAHLYDDGFFKNIRAASKTYYCLAITRTAGSCSVSFTAL